MTPPRLAEWLLSLAAGRRERDDVLADLSDEAAAIAREHGDRAAARWFRRQALASVGPLLRRRASGVLRWPSPGVIRSHLTFTSRSLRSSPAFTLTVVLLLALGIGAHAVVYAVVDALVLRPLPFGDRSPRLVTVHATHPTLATDWDDSEISYPDLLDLRRENATLEGLEGFIGRNVSISNGRESERVSAASVSPGLFELLGVAPSIGRGFQEADAAAPGAETAVLVSHALWHSLLGGEAAAVGGRVVINGRPLTVIGVMPPQFSFPDGQQVWLPYRSDPVDGRGRRNLLAVGLLRPGVTDAQNLADLRAVAGRLAERHPDTNRDWSVHVLPMRDFFVSSGDAGTLLAAMTLVLLVACANVAGLIIARGVSREGELALRAALGAGRLRLASLFVTECFVLAAAAGVLGALFATAGVRALVAWHPEPPPYWAMPAVDMRVTAFMVLMTGAVAMLSGLVPAVRLSRVDAAGAILPGARSTATRGHRRLQSVLVIGQVAASLALLVGALMLSRSATALFTADAGFKVDPLLSARFYIAGDRYDPPDVRSRVVNEVVDRIAAIPGVRAASATGSIPTDDGGESIRLDAGDRAAASREVGAQMVAVTPTFWEALGLRLVDGRTFTAQEAVDPGVDAIVVNRRLANLVWPGESPIGRALPVARDSGSWTGRVIGVAPDLVYEEFGEETAQSQLIVYVPNGRAGYRTLALLVSAEIDPAALAADVRSAVRSVDPGFATFDVLTMADRRAFNHWTDRFIGRTFFAFAIAALILASIGAYGMVAHMVAQRRREVGIRLAIGASRSSVLGLFLGTGGRLALVGLGVGLPVAYGVARVLERELFRVSPWTADLWIGPPLVLAIAILAAVYVPARRASRVDPVTALKA